MPETGLETRLALADLVVAEERGDAPPPVLRAVGISKIHGKGSAAVEALHPCSIELRPGTVTVVVGRSGSGKSTLLHVLSGLDTPTTGRVWMNGAPLSELSETQRARWRARYIGFVLQRDNLIPSLTLEENVAAPLILAGTARAEAVRRAREMLSVVGLSHRAGAWPANVSGGEAQRAAVARACGGSPRLLFSDEPTGSLDVAASNEVLDLFVELSHRTNAAALLVTHDPAASELADAVVRIEDGWLAAA
jgi:ABC-type lipoprotein export system ATPase subunit